MGESTWIALLSRRGAIELFIIFDSLRLFIGGWPPRARKQALTLKPPRLNAIMILERDFFHGNYFARGNPSGLFNSNKRTLTRAYSNPSLQRHHHIAKRMGYSYQDI